ncbi:MAG: sugar phosphate nucleotidyltransferase [Dehalococcoidia bacterium]
MKKLTSVILAGGQGKRMDILCYGRAKPGLPFAGEFRIIDFTLSNCIHSGIDEIAVLIDYQRSYMADYLRAWNRVNYEKNNLRILPPRAGYYKGTADAVYQNRDHLIRYNSPYILVLAADHVYKMDYRKMLNYHQNKMADITIGVIPVPIDQARRFGIMQTDIKGRVVEFTEKPKYPSSNLASMGIYIFNKDILLEQLVEDNADENSVHDFGHSIIPKLIKKHRVFAYTYGGYWQDIGTVEAYYQASMELTRKLPSFSLDSNWPIFTRDSILPSSYNSTSGSTNRSIISRDCIVKGIVEDSIISSGVRVEENAVIKNSVVMANSIIESDSIIDRCILDEDVHVSESCKIGVGTSLLPGNWDITIIGKGSRIPSHTIIARNCKIMPHVKSEDFSSHIVLPGTVLYHRTNI